MTSRAPFGSWRSPISAATIARGGVGLNGLRTSDGTIYWSELRPAEGGRTTVVRRDPDGATAERLAPPFDARTQVHEYGGGAWWVYGSSLYFANWTDQRLYRLDEQAKPKPITPAPEIARGLRYADGEMT